MEEKKFTYFFAVSSEDEEEMHNQQGFLKIKYFITDGEPTVDEIFEKFSSCIDLCFSN